VRTSLKITLLVFLLVAVAVIAREYVVRRQISFFGGERIAVKRFPFKSPGSVSEWDEKVLARRETVYTAVEHADRACVKAESEDSASTLFYKLSLSHKRRPFMSWKWLAEKFPERKSAENLNKKKEFDFVAQVYVVFHSRFFMNSKAIQYVWAENLPVGTVSDSPYTKNVKLIVLESGPSEEWKHEERDISEDYKVLFGEELKKHIDAIAFMTDSDSTTSSAVAYYTDITIGFLGGKTDMTTEPENEN